MSALQHMLSLNSRKGDYHRYLAEFASGEKRKVAATAAHEAYKVWNLFVDAPSICSPRERTLQTLLRPSSLPRILFALDLL